MGGRVRRWWAETWDNRVLAPRAYVVYSATRAMAAYLPASEYDALKPSPRAPWAGIDPASLGTPVYRLPEWMDRRDYEAEWRRGQVRAV